MVLIMQSKMYQQNLKMMLDLNYDRLKWRRKRGRVDDSHWRIYLKFQK